MAITLVEERFNGRKGSIDSKGVRHITRMFWVYVDSITDGPQSAANTSGSGLPGLYDFYITDEETDLGCIVKNISSSQLPENPLIYETTVEYDSAPLETQAFPSDQNNNQQQPNLRPWTYNITSNKSTKAQPTDTIGIPYLNSAQIPFDPPFEVPCSNPVIKITAYSSTFEITTILTYQDAVNSDEWYGFPIGTLRCIDYQAVSHVDNGAFYWTLDISLEAKFDLWQPVKILDAGVMEQYDSGSGVFKYRAITDAYGQPVTAAVCLNGSGQKNEPGDDPVFLEFYPYQVVSFVNLIPSM